MAIGSLIGGIASAALGTAASKGVSKLFGDDDSGRALARANRGARLDAGGFQGRSGQIRRTADRQELVDDLSRAFADEANLIGDLRGQFTPGQGALTAAVDNARTRAVGNLRENLSRRRVMGSSFAGDALSRAEAEFAQQRNRSFLQEVEISNNLIQQEFDSRRQQFQAQLDDMNLAAEIGTQLASQATAQLGANARFKAELAAKNAAGAGQFAGRTLGPAINEFGSGLGRGIDNLFGGGGISSSFPLNPSTTTQGFIF